MQISAWKPTDPQIPENRKNAYLAWAKNPVINDLLDPRFAARFKRGATTCAILSGLIGCSMILGWSSNLSQPNIAVGLMLGSIAILLTLGITLNHPGQLPIWTYRVGKLFGGLVGLIGFFHFGRTGLTAAICFTLFGLAVFLLDQSFRNRIYYSQILGILQVLSALPALVSYIFGFSSPDKIGEFTQVGIQSVVGIELLGLALLFSRPEQGFMQILCSKSTAGCTTRKLLLASIIIPFILASINLAGYQRGLYSGEHRFTFSLIASSIIFLILTLRIGRVLFHTDLERLESQRELENRIQLRTDELRQQEEQLRAIISSLTEGILVHDAATGQILEVNESAARITGVPIENLRKRRAGDTLWSAIHLNGHPFRHDEYPSVQALQTGKPVRNIEVGIHWPDGSVKWLMTHSEPMFRKGENKPFACVSSFFDITDRKNSEERLKASQKGLQRNEAELRLLANLIPQLVWMGDKMGTGFWYNERWTEFTGLSFEDLQGWGWAQVLHPDHRDRIIRRLNENLENGDPWEDTFPLRNKKGEWRWFLSRAHPLCDETGQVVRWFGTNTDITDQLELARHRDELIHEIELERARFEAVMKQMPAAVIVGEAPTGKLIFANDRLRSVWGHSLIPSDDINEYRNWKGFHPDGRVVESHEWPLARAISQGEVTQDEEIKIIWPNGEERTLRLNASPVRDRNQKIVAGVVICQDVTEQKAARSQLAESEARFRAILENSSAIVFMKDLRGNYIVANPALERLLNLSHDEIIGKTDFDILPHHFAEKLQKNDLKVLHTKKAYEVEERAETSEGEQVYLSSKFPVFDAQGQIQFLGGISTNITKRKRVEKALQDSERRYRSLANSVPHLIWSKTPDGSPSFFNRRWTEYSGILSSQLTSQDWLQLIHPDQREEALRRKSEGLKHGVPYQIEMQLRRHDGVYRWFTARVIPLKDDHHNILAWYGSAVDIEDQKQAEIFLRSTNDELEKRVQERTAALRAAIQELESFSYTVSHDLRAPLRGIDGFTRRLLQNYSDRLDEKGKHYLNRASIAAQRMGRLIDDLLNFSRLSRTPLIFQGLDLTAISRSIISELHHSDPNRNVQIRIADDLKAHGDPILIRSVLQNLIGNAWKYTSKLDQAVIELGKTQQNGKEVFYIRDNGAGFDMAYANKLFGAFQRLHSEEEFEGTGIGLATVRRILHRHQGEIWASAQVGRGATFYFTLGDAKQLRNRVDGEDTRDLAS